MITPFGESSRGVGHRHRRQQLPRVGVLRVLEDRAARADLDDLAQVHDRDAVADALDDGHVVRDEEVGQPNSACSSSSRLTICARIDTSSAETASSATMILRVERERARDGDPLPLAARELVRVALRHVGREAHVLEQPAHALLGRAPLSATPCTSSGSAIEKPTVRRGSSEANGSWKTIWMSRRSGRTSDGGRRAMSRAVRTRCCRPSTSTRRSSERPVVDLPQPDSPTSASVSPAARSKLTFSTAWTRRRHAAEEVRPRQRSAWSGRGP